MHPADAALYFKARSPSFALVLGLALSWAAPLRGRRAGCGFAEHLCDDMEMFGLLSAPAAAMPILALGLAMGRAQTYIYMEYKCIPTCWGCS